MSSTTWNGAYRVYITAPTRVAFVVICSTRDVCRTGIQSAVCADANSFRLTIF